jgi:copper transport protein
MGVLAHCAMSPVPAHAHAELLRSDPPSNAVLEESPAQIELIFTEAIEADLSMVSVLNSNGESVTAGGPKRDPNNSTRLTLAVPPLGDGVYTVAWRVIATDDGHPTSGSFPFAVGKQNADVVAEASSTTGSQLPLSALIYKWLLYISLAILVGQFSFMRLVWEPATRGLRASLPAYLEELSGSRRALKWASVGLMAGLGLSMLSQLGQAAGTGLALPWSPGASQVLLGSRLGLIWLARLGLALLVLLFINSRKAAWKSWAGFVIELLLLLSLSLEAHAATEPHPIIPVLADWVHLVGMSFWLGGLPFLLMAIRASPAIDEAKRTQLVSASMGHFSTMALASVAAVGATGLYAAYLRLGSFPALYQTTYGEVLVVKQVFVGLLMVLAALNLLWFSPRVRNAAAAKKANSPLVDKFGSSVLSEIVLGALLLLSVSVLTYLPPAKAPLPFEVLQTNSARDLRMTLDIVPGTLGNNSFKVHLTSGGRPVEMVDTALLRFNSLSHDVPQLDGPLQAVGNGDYTAEGNYLSLTGRWQVLVVVRRQNQFDAIAYFHFTLPAPVDEAAKQNMKRLGIALLAMDAILTVLAFRVLASSAYQRHTESNGTAVSNRPKRRCCDD